MRKLIDELTEGIDDLAMRREDQDQITEENIYDDPLFNEILKQIADKSGESIEAVKRVLQANFDIYTEEIARLYTDHHNQTHC